MKKLTALRKKLKEQSLDALLVTYDQNRRYLTGFTGTAGTVLVTEERAFLLTDFRYTNQATAEAPNFEVVEFKESVFKKVGELAEESGIKSIGFEQAHMSFKTYQTVKETVGCELVPTDNLVEALREIKDENEIALLKTAANIVDQTFDHMLTQIKPGVSELDLYHEMEHHMRMLGATASSFNMIVASGRRSALPHGVASEKVIEKGDMLTLDFGALYKGYRSDMTRTVAVGDPDDKLVAVYDIVQKALQIGTESIKPGVECKAVDKTVRDYITEKGYGENFGHGTGHGIGLDIHEGPSLSYKSEATLAINMVVTVEPGIYLDGLGGVRIEDDILVTADGYEVLTHSPRDLIRL
ncbi:Xaa-Pro aminopeptidase [Scopulibacillus darangshiensis]|uniref:Xaa-Pro aminopeptidase n=1 Tax=Scopulibacillus darangshiensis TaxID=442528 RepID=A0A4R2NNT6_9BACL|nr:Xaa-Pro peptidase family protein [Scopulibacillus darangshiensis]TCP23449.1 Xaa-Pro aminopeptidase [Scopulibacillus darangshiensis]